MNFIQNRESSRNPKVCFYMELIKNISLKSLIPFAIAFIAILSFHLSVDLTTGDYQYFRIFVFGYYEKEDVFSFLQWRYATWTSRLFVEFFTFWFVQYPTWIFSIINSVILLAIIAMTYLLFSKQKGLIYVITTILLTFAYKITDMGGDSGYLVTMIGYIWPFAAFLITLFPFKNSLEGQNDKPSIPLYILHGICAMFCCSCEQLCVAGILVWGIFIAYTYMHSKSINYLYCVLLLIAFVNLALIGLCPGNTARTLALMHFVPDYENFSIFKKIALCIATPICKYMYVDIQSKIVWVFSIILPFTMYMRKKYSMIALFISTIPLLMLLSTHVEQYLVTMELITNSELTILCTISTIFYGSILFSLLYIGNNKKSLIAKYGPSIVFVVGLSSRAAIGLTLSYAEVTRTYFLLEYSMVAISIIYLSTILSEMKIEINRDNH